MADEEGIINIETITVLGSILHQYFYFFKKAANQMAVFEK